MSATRAELFAFLEQLSIEHKTCEHQPVFTVEQSAAVKANLPGGHTKNLFLKDKTGALFLICAQSDTMIAVNKLHTVLGCRRLSFARAEVLQTVLGVLPGSVSLFALMNDKAGAVSLIVDKILTKHDIVNFHPLNNDATTAISSLDMIKFAVATGHTPQIMAFDELN